MVTGNDFLRHLVVSLRLLQEGRRVHVQFRRQSGTDAGTEVDVAVSHELEGRLEAVPLPLAVHNEVDVEVLAGGNDLL